MTSSVLPRSSTLPTTSTSRLTFFTLFLLWWGCNNLFALHTHSILTAHTRVPHLFIDLSFVQVLIALPLSLLFSHFFHPPTTNDAQKPPPRAQQALSHPVPLLSGTLCTPFFLAISAFHLAGAQLTNSSYGLVGSTSTLVWKLTEPLTAVLLRRLILHETSSPTSLFAMSLVLLGALLFSAPNFSLHFSPVILANFFIPLRNILLKRSQYSSPHPRSTAQTFFNLSVCALPFALLALLVKNAVYGFHIPPVHLLIQNSVLFNSYHLASIALLQRMDVLTHSLANALKRFTGIALTAFVTGEQFTPMRFIALLLTAIGFPIHVMGKHNLHVLRCCRHISLLSALQMFLLLLFLVELCTDVGSLPRMVFRFNPSKSLYSMRDIHFSLPNGSAPQSVSDQNNFSTRQRSQNSERKPSPQISSPSIVSVAGTYISTNRVYHSEEEAQTFPDTNSGNMVWQYGGYIQLVDFTKSVTCNDTHVNCIIRDPAMKEMRMVHYRPAANGFNRKMNLTFDDAFERLEHKGDAILYVGIGIQYSFKDDTSRDDMYLGERIENKIEDFRFTPAAERFLKKMNELRIPMLMRGDLTVQASRRAGYSYGVSTGCPSLFINEDIYLGASMERKYRELIQRKGDTSVKIAFNLAGRHRLFKWMKSIADRYPGSLFYSQGPEDFRVLRNHNVSFDKIRFFGNIPDWIESLSKMDLSIGPRIHGNMAAVAAGTPALVIAPDFRVLEMAERMHIPHTTMYDGGLEKGMDVAELVSRMGFDGMAFDENRCRIAREYKRLFSMYGIHLSHHVERITAIC